LTLQIRNNNDNISSSTSSNKTIFSRTSAMYQVFYICLKIPSRAGHARAYL
jgi:hypothetical protein